MPCMQMTLLGVVDKQAEHTSTLAQHTSMLEQQASTLAQHTALLTALSKNMQSLQTLFARHTVVAQLQATLRATQGQQQQQRNA